MFLNRSPCIRQPVDNPRTKQSFASPFQSQMSQTSRLHHSYNSRMIATFLHIVLCPERSSAEEASCRLRVTAGKLQFEMTEGILTTDVHEFPLQLPNSASTVHNDDLRKAIQRAKEQSQTDMSPWQETTLYAKLTGKKGFATLKDTMDFIDDALLTLSGEDIGRARSAPHCDDFFFGCKSMSGPKDQAGPALKKESTLVCREEVQALPQRFTTHPDENKVLQDDL